MYVWIMDYVLSFLFFKPIPFEGSHRSHSGQHQRLYGLLSNSLKRYLSRLINKVTMTYILPGDSAPAQNLSSAGSVTSSTVGSKEDGAPNTPPVSRPSTSTRGLSMRDYHHYMAGLLTPEELTPLSSPGASSTETSPTIKGNVSQTRG